MPSCETGTSHAAKQNERVAQGFDAAYDPYWKLLKPSQIGLAGHSYGAAGVSYVAQWDPRVKAVVAWDNLGGPGPEAGSVPSQQGGSPPIEHDRREAAARPTRPRARPCRSPSPGSACPPTTACRRRRTPALPEPHAKSTESLAYSQAGVDSGEIIIRGGSHLDFSFIPNQAFGASLRGADEVAWYTSAWFDKYVKHQASADKRLLSNRWREDPAEAAVDPNHDGNAFSFYYLSRLDIHLRSGQAFDCEDLREGCAGMVATKRDRYSGEYSYLGIDTSPDASSGPGAGLPSR